MTPYGGWHLTRSQLAEYTSGRPPLARAASVEAHLTACGHCRAMLEGLVPDMPVDRMWQQIMHRVDAPRTGRFRRAVERVWTRSTPTLFPPTALHVRWAGLAAALVVGLTLAGQPSPARCEAGVAGAGPPRPAAVPLEPTPVGPDGYVTSPDGYTTSPDGHVTSLLLPGEAAPEPTAGHEENAATSSHRLAGGPGGPAMPRGTGVLRGPRSLRAPDETRKRGAGITPRGRHWVV